MDSIRKNERTLLVVNELVTGGRQNLKRLYQFIETSGVAVTRATLATSYQSISVLSGKRATLDGFVQRLRTLCRRRGIKAVDVFIQLHGLPGELRFYDKGYSTETVRDRILAANLPDKLRLLYSTACFGESHNRDVLGAGFKVSLGGKGEVANAATEFPTFCTAWAAGRSVNQAIRMADRPAARKVQDAAGRALGFNNVDSKKVVVGSGNLTIGRTLLGRVTEAGRAVAGAVKKKATQTKKTARRKVVTAKKKAAGTAKRVTGTARKTAGTVKRKATKKVSSAKKTASRTASNVKNTARRKTKKAKSTARNVARSIGDRLRR